MATVQEASEPSGAITRVTSVSLNDEELTASATAKPQLPRNNYSISERRTRAISALLFAEIVGNRLKCYEKWRLWATLCVIMTAIAIASITVATVLAVEHSNAYKTKSEAITVQHTMIEELFKSNTSNETDVSDQVRRIFNTFDDDHDGLWDIDEFADHLNRATEREAIFNRMDTDHDNILSFTEVVFAKSQQPPQFSEFISRDIISNYYNYTGATNTALYWHYEANLMFNLYGSAEKGYITREDYYRYHATRKFMTIDVDSNGFIDFDEFNGNTVNIDFIERFKTNPTIIHLLNSTIFQPFVDRNLNAGAGAPVTDYYNTSMDLDTCPSVMTSGEHATRRRMGKSGDRAYIDFLVAMGVTHVQWEEPYGSIKYIVECDMTYPDCLWDWWDSKSCVEEAMTAVDEESEIFECMVSVYNCMGPDSFERCIGAYGRDQTATDRCECYCVKEEERRRRLMQCEVASCDDSSCFAGDNRIWIKREDVMQNIWMKELRVGDYVHSKSGGWTKVWWVKRLRREHKQIAHLRLYFGEEEYLTVTPNHLLYVDVLKDEYSKRADQVRVGDRLFVLDHAIGYTMEEFVEKEVVSIGYTMEDITYGAATMDGSVVVGNVLASAYEGSYERAAQIHRMTMVVRFISEYINEELAAYITDLNFYYVFDPLQKYDLGYVVFNAYSAPFITIMTIGAPTMVSLWTIRELLYSLKCRF